MDLANTTASENWIKIQQIKSRIAMIELYLLVGGTFVWGMETYWFTISREKLATA